MYKLRGVTSQNTQIFNSTSLRTCNLETIKNSRTKWEFTDEINFASVCVLTSVRSSSRGCNILLSNMMSPFFVQSELKILLLPAQHLWFPSLLFFSHRSTVFGSRGHGLASKPVLKDTRPLSDKQFQNTAVQKVWYVPRILRVVLYHSLCITLHALNFVSTCYLGQCFSTFVRPRSGKFSFYKTRARSQQIYS